MNQITSNGPSAVTELTRPAPISPPPADILEKGDTVVMLMDVPGADPASLDVTLDKRILTITAPAASGAPQGDVGAHLRVRRRPAMRPLTSSSATAPMSAASSFPNRWTVSTSTPP